jgi:hypothetical protein
MSKKDERRFYVYSWLRQEDSDCGSRLSPYYVGKGTGNRAYDLKRCGAKPPKDQSYIVFVQEGLTEQEAFNLERYCIDLYGRIDLGTGILRNLTNGGEGASGCCHSIETREKMSRARLGNQHRLGKRHTQKTKDQMSRSHLGRNLSQEHKNKISQSKTGIAFSQQHKNKMSQVRLRYLYELIDPRGEIYITDNMRGFAKQYGLSYGALGKVAQGKANHHKGWTGRIVESLK